MCDVCDSINNKQASEGIDICGIKAWIIAFFNCDHCGCGIDGVDRDRTRTRRAHNRQNDGYDSEQAGKSGEAFVAHTILLKKCELMNLLNHTWMIGLDWVQGATPYPLLNLNGVSLKPRYPLHGMIRMSWAGILPGITGRINQAIKPQNRIQWRVFLTGLIFWINRARNEKSLFSSDSSTVRWYRRMGVELKRLLSLSGSTSAELVYIILLFFMNVNNYFKIEVL